MEREQRIQALEKELAECHDSLSSKDREATKLEEQVKQLRAILEEMEKAGDQSGNGQSVAVVRIQQELDSVRDECGELEKANAALEDKLTQERSQTQELTKSIQKLTEERDALNRDVECYKKERVVLKEEVVKLQDNVKTANAQAEIYEQDFKQERRDRENAHDLKEEIRLACDMQVHAKEIECQNLTEENTALRERLTELEQSLGEKRKKAGDMKKESKISKKKNKKGAGPLQEDDEQDTAVLEEKIQTLSKEITGLQEQLASAQEEAALKKIGLEEKMKVSDKLRQELEDAKRDRETVARQLSRVRTELDEANKRISELNEHAQQIDRQGMKAENKALKEANNELKRTLAQLKQKLSSSHTTDAPLTFMQRFGASKELHTGAQKRVSFKEQPDQKHHSQSGSTPSGPEVSTANRTSYSGHRQHAPPYENSQYHMQRRPRADSSPNPPQSTDKTRPRNVSPSSSLPMNFQQHTTLSASHHDSKVPPSSVHECVHSEVGASGSHPNQEYQSHTNPAHKKSQPASPSRPQPIITSRQSPSETTAHPSPSQSLPTKINLANIPDVDEHLYLNLLDEDFDLQSDSDLALQDNSHEHSGDQAESPQHSYVNLPNFDLSGEQTVNSVSNQETFSSHKDSSSESKGDQAESPQHSYVNLPNLDPSGEQTTLSNDSVSDQERFSGCKDSSSESKGDIYVNLPDPDSDMLYVNLTSDFGVENSQHVSQSDQHFQNVEQSCKGSTTSGFLGQSDKKDKNFPVPAPRKLKPKVNN